MSTKQQKAVITITDCENGNINIKLDFIPAIVNNSEPCPSCIQAAVDMVKLFTESQSENIVSIRRRKG